MRAWSVGGGIITSGDSLLLVHNRRSNGQTDWTTPGGVIDPGETMLEGLTREVIEETGLVVSAWQGPVYTVVADAPDMGWTLTVEAYLSQAHAGELTIDDPDGIVFDARWVASSEIVGLLEGQQRWFTEPLLSYLAGQSALDQPAVGQSALDQPAVGQSALDQPAVGRCPRFCYVVHGSQREELSVERVDDDA